MYRIGHGDCFLLAFAGEEAEQPVYVLIDCGYKPGSPAFINTRAAEIWDNIREATGGHLDVAIITHEHQDHVNGITRTYLKGITIGETWLAWTEDPKDKVADALRETFHDKLLGLLAARHRLAAAGDDKLVKSIDRFLEFELGGDSETFDVREAERRLGAARDPSTSMNKRSMKLFKDRSQNGIKYLRPHEEIHSIPRAGNLRVFALGPPRDPEKLQDLDPRGQEKFHGVGLDAMSPGNFFAAAAKAGAGNDGPPLFAQRYCVPFKRAHTDREHGKFFTDHYGREGARSSAAAENAARGASEASANPGWRRIDKEWLFSAEQLALDMNDQTNNASLVLAFELGKGGKVLLFAADAQRGNWASWADDDWKDGDDKVTARDLLSRTVLYKVGHHGSHNATLNGLASDATANLAWMATGEHGREFTAMITAVRKWAETQNGWDHPLKAIKDALLKKASGRVFQTDTDLDQITCPEDVSPADWKLFQSRVIGDRLFFDCKITG